MGRTLEAWRIISGIGICNRQPDTLRLRLIGSRASGRIRPSIYERVEALASLAYGRPPLAATSTPLKECQWQKPSIARRRTDCASERRRPGRLAGMGGRLRPHHRQNAPSACGLAQEPSGAPADWREGKCPTLTIGRRRHR